MSASTASIRTFPQTLTGASATRLIAPPTGAEATRPRASRGFVVKALSTNTQPIYVGGAGVTTANGFELTAGQMLPVPHGDPSAMYGIPASGTQEVRVIYL